MDGQAAALTLVIFIILTALVFDYVNGFHDSANSIATVVGTRVLSPSVAVFWAAFFNFIAFLVFGTKVAQTISKGIVNDEVFDPHYRLYILLAALIGAIAWNLITWYLGLPSSSSHALIGGYGGAALAAFIGFNGFQRLDTLYVAEGWIKTITFIVLSPLIGLISGYFMMVAVYWIFRRFTVSKVDRVFRFGQLFSAAAFSLGHGGNDAQKTMGIITLVLAAYSPANFSKEHIPLWVVLAAHTAIALGTLSGGWRIVKTMGTKLAKLQPVNGFCAETAGALTLFGATAAGIPVSTTHTITGAIVGVGATKRLSAVKWGVAGRIVWAWILTIPMAALIAAIAYEIIILTAKVFGY